VVITGFLKIGFWALFFFLGYFGPSFSIYFGHILPHFLCLFCPIGRKTSYFFGLFHIHNQLVITPKSIKWPKTKTYYESLKPANVSKTNITSLQHMALKIPPAQAQNPST
jgi:hypothetical protein